MAWEMRPYVESDFDGVRDLYRSVFGHSRPIDHDRWKYQENPNGERIAVVAVDGDIIVGQYALWPVNLRLGTEVVLGAQSLDTMSHPDYRGQGMFIRSLGTTTVAITSAGVDGRRRDDPHRSATCHRGTNGGDGRQKRMH